MRFMGHFQDGMRKEILYGGIFAGVLVAVLTSVMLIVQPAFSVEEPAATATDVQVVQSLVGYVDDETQEYIAVPDREAGDVPFIESMHGQLQLLPTVVWSTGTAEYAEDAGVPVTWESGDTSVAVVDQNGLVEPVGYGVATITMRTSDDFGAVVGSIDVNVGVWEGAYLEKLVITDGDSPPSGDDPLIVPVHAQWGALVQFYAEAHYSDGTVKSTKRGDRIAGLEWSTSWYEFGDIDRETGLFSSDNAGSNTVRATAPSGRGDDIVACAYTDTEGRGTGEFFIPSTTLTVHIVHDSEDGWVEESSKIYSGGDFARLGLQRHAYTQILGYQSFMTITARGVPVLYLLYDQAVDPSDVTCYYASTVDATKIPFSAIRVNEPGYYFPLAYIGFSNYAQEVPAMIAIESYYERDRRDPYYGDLDPNSRFHLVMGSKSLDNVIDEQPMCSICDLYVLLKDEAAEA